MNAQETASKIVDTAARLGWKLEVRGSILEIQKTIRSNDNDDFCRADQEYYSILSLLPTTGPGSIWGTNGGGVGALTAMRTGQFVMKKSGGSKRVLSALQKMI